MMQEDGTIATISTIQQPRWLHVLEENDAVLVQPHCPLNDAQAAGHCDVCPVSRIYNKEQEDLLVTAGARLPPRLTKEGYNHIKTWCPTSPLLRAPSPSLLSSPAPRAETPAGKLHGRVMSRDRKSIKVLYMDDKGEEDIKTFTPPFSNSLVNTKTGEAILLRRHPNGKVTHVTTFSSEMEDHLFYSNGVTFPDPPVELHPGGYYG